MKFNVRVPQQWNFTRPITQLNPGPIVHKGTSSPCVYQSCYRTLINHYAELDAIPGSGALAFFEAMPVCRLPEGGPWDQPKRGQSFPMWPRWPQRKQLGVPSAFQAGVPNRLFFSTNFGEADADCSLITLSTSRSPDTGSGFGFFTGL